MNEVLIIRKDERGYSVEVRFSGNSDELAGLIKTIEEVLNQTKSAFANSIMNYNPEMKERIEQEHKEIKAKLEKLNMKGEDFKKMLDAMCTMSMDDKLQLLKDFKGLIEGK